MILNYKAMSIGGFEMFYLYRELPYYVWISTKPDLDMREDLDSVCTKRRFSSVKLCVVLSMCVHICIHINIYKYILSDSKLCIANVSYLCTGVVCRPKPVRGGTTRDEAFCESWPIISLSVRPVRVHVYVGCSALHLFSKCNLHSNAYGGNKWKRDERILSRVGVF